MFCKLTTSTATVINTARGLDEEASVQECERTDGSFTTRRRRGEPCGSSAVTAIRNIPVDCGGRNENTNKRRSSAPVHGALQSDRGNLGEEARQRLLQHRSYRPAAIHFT